MINMEHSFVVQCTRKDLLQHAQEESQRIILDDAQLGEVVLAKTNPGKNEEKEIRNEELKYDLEEKSSCGESEDGESIKQLQELFTPSEGICNWVPIDAPHKTASRYMEFFVPTSLDENDESDSLDGSESKNNRNKRDKEKNSEEELVESRYREKKNRFTRERKKPCAMCCVKFPIDSLTTTVSRQALYRQRQKWAKKFPSSGAETEPERKYRFRLYDEQKVCLFCAQLFDFFENEVEKKNTKKQKTKTIPKKPIVSRSTVVVTAVGRTRLEELCFKKLASKNMKKLERTRAENESSKSLVSVEKNKSLVMKIQPPTLPPQNRERISPRTENIIKVS